MRFKISTKILKKSIDIVNHAIANISTTPILENILIQVNKSNIIFTGNNLERAIEHIVFDDITIMEEGSFCIPSRLFTNYISLIEDDEVEIDLLSNNSLEIKTNSSNVKIKGNNTTDFPVIPKGVFVSENNFVISSDILKNSIEKTLFSAGEGNVRQTLAGVYINIENNIAKFVATDSFRISEFSVELPNNISEKFSQIIPSKTANQLRNLLLSSNKVDIKLYICENQIGFLFNNTKLYSNLLNGKFPDYESFFPDKYKTKAVINKNDLINSLKKINLISREDNFTIKISFSSETGILLETSQTQIGEGKMNIIGSVEGEEAIIGLNSEYLLEVLNVIEETHISMSFESDLSPVLVVGVLEDKNKKDYFRHIIMPIKI